jgi:hypothetical protein
MAGLLTLQRDDDSSEAERASVAEVTDAAGDSPRSDISCGMRKLCGPGEQNAETTPLDNLGGN